MSRPRDRLDDRDRFPAWKSRSATATAGLGNRYVIDQRRVDRETVAGIKARRVDDHVGNIGRVARDALENRRVRMCAEGAQAVAQTISTGSEQGPPHAVRSAAIGRYRHAVSAGIFDLQIEADAGDRGGEA